MANTENTILAGGSFWGMQELTRNIPGVTSTCVGYTGGHIIDPTYELVKNGDTGHVESVLISFNPDKISFRELIIYFFRIHDPTILDGQGHERGSQYSSIIFYHTEDQRQTAHEMKNAAEIIKRWKAPIVTKILPASCFYKAEDYHQDYLQRNPNGHNAHWLRD